MLDKKEVLRDLNDKIKALIIIRDESDSLQHEAELDNQIIMLTAKRNKLRDSIEE